MAQAQQVKEWTFQSVSKAELTREDWRGVIPCNMPNVRHSERTRIFIFFKMENSRNPAPQETTKDPS